MADVFKTLRAVFAAGSAEESKGSFINGADRRAIDKTQSGRMKNCAG
jgi:hypothetical protein